MIQTTDFFDTTPALYQVSWGARTSTSYGSMADAVRGPKIGAGQTRTLSWSWVIHSTFDTHYTVYALTPASDQPGPDLASMTSESAEQWAPWTSVQVC